MSAYTGFISSIAFPLHERIKRHDSVRIRKSLEASQWLSRDQIEEIRLSRLREFLALAGDNVPYYRELFAKVGFRPDEVRAIADLSRIPLLDKTRIRANLQGLKSEKSGALARFSTGGSTGEPLIFYLGQRVSHDVAAKWRATRWWDVDIGDREIVLWGSPIELGSQDIFKSLRDRMLRSTLLSAFNLSDERLALYVDTIREKRPSMLFGYPSVLSLIAGYARERTIRLDDIGVKVAFVTAERLYDWQKSVIEEVFSCKVANGYGGRDAGFVAHECPSGGMHITAEDIIVEILDEHGASLPPGERGELVVTHMATPDFPFIRYRTGDIASLSDRACACGRGLPMIESIEGRSTDFVVTGTGKRLHGLSLIYVLREQTGIRNFRIVQERADQVQVLVVPDKGYSPETQAAIRHGIRSRMDPDTEVVITTLDRLPDEPSGKYRYVVSKLAGATASGGG